MAQSDRLRGLKFVGWVLESFGPLIAFYALLKTVGLLAAIISGLVTGVLLVAREIWRDRRVSALTAFTALSVVIFGFLELRYRTGFFVKLEPALGNAVTGLFFLGTVALGRPLIVEIAEKQRGSRMPDSARAYMRTLTVVWGLFFFARTAAYVWMAYHVSLERALVIRGVLGPVSFGLLFAAEIGYRFLRFGKKALFPEDEENASLPKPDGVEATAS